MHQPGARAVVWRQRDIKAVSERSIAMQQTLRNRKISCKGAA
jgi:hypothetical protein